MKEKLRYLQKALKVYNSRTFSTVNTIKDYKKTKTSIYVETINGMYKSLEKYEQNANELLNLEEYNSEKGNRISEGIYKNITVLDSICKLSMEDKISRKILKKDCMENINSYFLKMKELDESLCHSYLKDGYKRAIKYSTYSHIVSFLENN